MKGVTTGSKLTSTQASGHHLQGKNSHRRDMQNEPAELWVMGPTARNLGSRPRNPDVVKKLTMFQEGSRRPHDAAGLLDDQRPQPNEERGTHPGPP